MPRNYISLTSHLTGKLEMKHKVRRMASGFAAAGFRVAATAALDLSEIDLHSLEGVAIDQAWSSSESRLVGRVLS